MNERWQCRSPLSLIFIWTSCLLWSSRARYITAFARPLATSTFHTSLLNSAAQDYNELPLDFPRRNDVLVALNAVRKACTVTSALQPSTTTTTDGGNNGISTVTKDDLSPVTVADFAAQALVLDHLHQAFSADSYIAEESSASLDENPDLALQVLIATSMRDVKHVKASIDLGQDYLSWNSKRGGRPPRVWCLDPIDGTRGFLRGKQQGGQYCVALALLEDGVPTIGILGCPNLPASSSDFNYAWKADETEGQNADSRGCLFVASKDGGCYQLPLIPGSPGRIIRVTPNDETSIPTSQGRFCLGVEKYSDALGQCRGMAKIIHGDSALDTEGEIVLARRFDSQAKYGVLGRAGAEFYARLPKPGYVEWIWDHAAGKVVIEEAGGTMTDVDGNPIDFSLGAKLSENVHGILASNGGKFHSVLVDAFRKQEEARLQGLSSFV